jgi:ABC-type branched-subunit amino acid transport system substrate-binding protein
MRTWNRKVLAAGVALVLVAASCGGDHGSDDDTEPATTAASAATTAAATSAVSATTVAPAGGASTAPAGTTGNPTAVATTAPATTAAPAGEMFGDLPSPCGEGDAAGATANGVTDTDITIGYGDDSDYPPAPGLTKEIGDSLKMMIDWCNAQGGINGRTIVGNYYDAKLLQVAEAMTQACNDKVFMLVGEGWALDAGQEQIRIDCQLSAIPTYTVSTAFAHGSGMVQPAPNPGDESVASPAFQLAELYPEAVKKAAFVFAEYPPTRETRDKAVAGYPAAGWTFLDCDQIYNIAGEADWKPFAENLKACGAEMVVYVGSPTPNLQNLLTAAQQVDYDPIWTTDANNYTQAFAEWNAANGDAAHNLYVRMAYTPFELADQSPATQKFLDLNEASGGKLGLLGAQTASAFLLWATAASECGSDLTAKCVLDNAGAQSAWTGGGLQTAMNVGANEGPTCGMLIQTKDGAWAKSYPQGDELFDCSDAYLVKGITTTAVEAAMLDANRVATQFGQFTPA